MAIRRSWTFVANSSVLAGFPYKAESEEAVPGEATQDILVVDSDIIFLFFDSWSKPVLKVA